MMHADSFSCPVQHHCKQNSNLTTMLCQTHFLCHGRLYEYKAPLDAQELHIYFILQYFIHIDAEEDKGNETEIHRNYTRR